MNFKLWLINLADAEQRRVWQISQLEILQIPFQIFRGLSGVETTDAFASKFPNSKLEHEELGCWGSHLSLWQQLANSDDNQIFCILEDDVLVPHDFLLSIDEILRTAPEGWDMIYLAGIPKRGYSKVKRLERFDRWLVSYARLPHTTGAYLVNQAGAIKALNIVPRIDAVDVAIARQDKMTMRIFGVYPPIIIRDYLDSPDRYQSLRHRRNRKLSWRVRKIFEKLYFKSVVFWKAFHRP